MPLHLVTPFDRPDAPEDEQPLFPPVPTWRSRIADGCYIVLRGSLFLGSSYLMALGLPLLEDWLAHAPLPGVQGETPWTPRPAPEGGPAIPLVGPVSPR